MHGIAKSIRMFSVTPAILTAGGLASAGPRYRIEVIGHEPDWSVFQTVHSVAGLNNRGEVAFNYGRSIQVAPTWSRGVTDTYVSTSAGIIAISKLGGDNMLSRDITDNGLVVGGATTQEFDPKDSESNYFASFVSRGSLTDKISTPDVGSIASAANNQGEVVGWSWSETFSHKAFKWSKSNGYEDLGDFGALYFDVNGLNERGDILIRRATHDVLQYGAGYNYNPQETLIWNSGKVTQIPDSEFRITQGWAINDHGAVVGDFATIPGIESHAFIWDEQNGFRDLGLDGEYSFATDVNNARVVIGAYAEDYGQQTTPFVHSDEFGRQRLFGLIANREEWISLESATHVNDLGQIAGIGRFGYGFNNRRIYLATPIPEPELATLLGASAFLLTSIRRRGST